MNCKQGEIDLFKHRTSGFLAGAPYSGKSRTVKEAQRVHPGLVFIETSDALKACSRGEEALGYMRKGDIVPFDLVLTALREQVNKLGDGQVALFGGFPRDPEQGTLAVTLRLPVCHLDTNLSTCVARAHARMAEALVGQADPIRGKRDDEMDPDVLIRRFGLYAFKTLPALQLCAEAGILRVIDGGSEPQERGPQLVRMLGLS